MNLLCSDFFISTLCVQGSHCAVVAYYSSHGQWYLPIYIAKRSTILPWWGYPSTLSHGAVPRRNSPTPAALKWYLENLYRGHGSIMDYTVVVSPPAQCCQKCPPRAYFWRDHLSGQILELWETVFFIYIHVYFILKKERLNTTLFLFLKV